MKLPITKPSFLVSRSIAALCAAFAFCSVASAQTVIWSGANAGADINWSDSQNWLGDAIPGAGNTALFDDNGTSSASISAGGAADNIVDHNFTVASLLYEQTNNSAFGTLSQIWHNTVINPNTTLTVANTNISIMLDSGTLSDPPSGLTYCYNTISGAGALDVNNTNAGSAICVQQGSGTYAGDQGQWAVLDMSGLNTFNTTVGRLMIGVQGIGATPGQVNLFNDNRATGWLYLAATNNITLTQPGVVQGTGNPGAFAAAAGPALTLADTYGNFSDFQCFLYLGQKNTISADTITIGRNQTYHTAHFGFNTTTYPSGPTLTLGGFSSNRVAQFIVADDTAWPGNGSCCVGAGASPDEMVQPTYDASVTIGCAGLVDLSEGTSTIMIDNLTIAKGWNGVGITDVNSGPAGKVLGVFNMGAGTLDVNTLELGVQSSSSATTPVTGTLNVNGGIVLVHDNQISLGTTLGGSAIATGNLNVTNGGSLTLGGGFGIVDSGQSLSEVTVDNATVTTANIGSSAAPIGNITLGDSTLNLAVGTINGSVVANSLTTESASVGITINITSIGQVPGLEQIITLISSGNPIAYTGSFTGGVNGSDFILGSLPSGYAGHLQITASAVQLVLTKSTSVPDSWTGADISAHHNTNWSDVNNWSAGVEPSLSNPAYFLTTGSVSSSALSHPGGGAGAIVAANLNNIVDGNVTTIGLTYNNTNGTYQNTYISNNATLTASASGLGMAVGASLQDLGNTTGNVTISGPGALDVNSGFYVGLGDTNSGSAPEATLDMSALTTFNATVPTFLVGAGTAVPQAGGVVYLAQNNTITATSAQSDSSDSSPVALEVGDSSTLAGSVRSALYLGQSNTIDASAISVGRQLAGGGIFFNPAVTNANPTIATGPWAFFRGSSGDPSMVGSWTIGDGVANSGSPALVTGTGANDFTGGYVNALVNTLSVANSSSGSGQVSAVTGTLTYNSGTITANTVNVSLNNAYTDGHVYNYGVGTVNVNGTAALNVNNTLNLAYTGGSPASGSVLPTATLGINGGSVVANDIMVGANGADSVISMNDGTLACSNSIGSSTAPLTTLNMTNSTINIALSSASAPFIDAANINAGGTNTISVLSLPSIIESYPVTITVLQSATTIKGTINNIKVVIPSGYAGTAAPSGNSTAILLTLTSGPVGTRGNVFWTGADALASVSANWSDATNWSLSQFGLLGVPGPGDSAIFDNADVSSASISSGGFADNIVDRNFTVAALWYEQTNADEYSLFDQIWHNTVINPNTTLTLANTNISLMLDSGTQTDPPSGYTYCYNTISGGGALVVNNTNAGSAISVEQGSGTYTGAPGLDAILDMSGLYQFSATVGRLMVGVEGVGATAGQVSLFPNQRASGVLSLAATNVITLTQAANIPSGVAAAASGPALIVSDLANFGDNPSILNLGQSNAIYADTATIGRNGSLQSAAMQFNPTVFSSSSLYLRGYSSNRVSEFIVADGTINGNSSQYETPDSRIAITPQISGGFYDGESALVDLSAGSQDIMVDSLILGNGFASAGGGYVVALFNMGPGTLNANTLVMGAVTAPAANKPVTGILNVPAGGVVIVNNRLVLGQGFGGAPSSLGAGNLNINGGAVSANDVVADGNTNSIISVINGGILSLTSPAGSIGTGASPIGGLSVGTATLNLAIGGSAAPVVAGNVSFAGGTATINVTELPLIDSAPAIVPLVQQTAGPISGSTFVLGTLPTGYTGTLQMSPDNTTVELKVTGVPTFPSKGTFITGVTLQASAGDLLITGTNGLPDAVYYVLTSTNLINWTPIATNTFDSNGRLSATLPYSASGSGRFYKIESQ